MRARFPVSFFLGFVLCWSTRTAGFVGGFGGFSGSSHGRGRNEPTKTGSATVLKMGLRSFVKKKVIGRFRGDEDGSDKGKNNQATPPKANTSNANKNDKTKSTSTNPLGKGSVPPFPMEKTTPTSARSTSSSINSQNKIPMPSASARMGLYPTSSPQTAPQPPKETIRQQLPQTPSFLQEEKKESVKDRIQRIKSGKMTDEERQAILSAALGGSKGPIIRQALPEENATLPPSSSRRLSASPFPNNPFFRDMAYSSQGEAEDEKAKREYFDMVTNPDRFKSMRTSTGALPEEDTTVTFDSVEATEDIVMEIQDEQDQPQQQEQQEEEIGLDGPDDDIPVLNDVSSRKSTMTLREAMAGSPSTSSTPNKAYLPPTSKATKKPSPTPPPAPTPEAEPANSGFSLGARLEAAAEAFEKRERRRKEEMEAKRKAVEEEERKRAEEVRLQQEAEFERQAARQAEQRRKLEEAERIEKERLAKEEAEKLAELERKQDEYWRMKLIEEKELEEVKAAEKAKEKQQAVARAVLPTPPIRPPAPPPTPVVVPPPPPAAVPNTEIPSTVVNYGSAVPAKPPVVAPASFMKPPKEPPATNPFIEEQARRKREIDIQRAANFAKLKSLNSPLPSGRPKGIKPQLTEPTPLDAPAMKRSVPVEPALNAYDLAQQKRKQREETRAKNLTPAWPPIANKPADTSSRNRFGRVFGGGKPKEPAKQFTAVKAPAPAVAPARTPVPRPPPPVAAPKPVAQKPVRMKLPGQGPAPAATKPTASAPAPAAPRPKVIRQQVILPKAAAKPDTDQEKTSGGQKTIREMMAEAENDDKDEGESGTIDIGDGMSVNASQASQSQKWGINLSLLKDAAASVAAEQDGKNK